jgi:hypothetical protein
MATSYRRFMVCGLGVLAWCWCIAGGTAAHEPVATSQSGNSDSVQHRSDIAWDGIEWTERRYKIEALGFKARDETGNSWLGSDEVMIRTDDAKGWTVSGQIGDIDSGDAHHFDPVKSCIIPVRPGIVVLGKTSVCDDSGEAAPLGFAVEFWEKDWFGGFGRDFAVLARRRQARMQDRIVRTTMPVTISSVVLISICRYRTLKQLCPTSAMNILKPSYWSSVAVEVHVT